MGAVEKVRFYPQTPQGGLSKLLDFNKSPLGVPIAPDSYRDGIGVSQRKLTFSTPPAFYKLKIIAFTVCLDKPFFTLL